MDKSLIAILLLLIPNLALAQTHTMPGSNVVPSGASLTIQSGATITAAGGSTVTGFGGGNVNNSGTPTAGQKATWVDATHIQGVTDNALQWDGGSTNLDAAAGRISLGGTIAGIALFTLAAPAGSANWIKIGSLGTITTEDAATTRTSLGLAIGTNVQAADTDLTTWAGVTPTSGIQTWLATPNSANLRGAVTDENGTGALLFNGATTPNFVTGITIDSAATGFLQGVSGSFKASAYTLPSTVIGTAGRVLYTDSTNLILSAAAYPTTAGTTGYLVRSDGTNFTSYPNQQTNSSTTNQSLSTSDVYLAGSSCVVAAGDFKAKRPIPLRVRPGKIGWHGSDCHQCPHRNSRNDQRHGAAYLHLWLGHERSRQRRVRCGGKLAQRRQRHFSRCSRHLPGHA